MIPTEVGVLNEINVLTRPTPNSGLTENIEDFSAASNSIIGDAGRWYRANRAVCRHPVVREIQRQFGLSALDAIKAIRVANGGLA